MRRREFITLVGGAMAWPVAVRAQQPDRMRCVGVLMNLAENDATAQGFFATFRQRLQQLGWSDGRNIRIETRWGAGDAALYRKYAAELIALGSVQNLSHI
jgi:putative ABC transport system substrate-binding protein